MNYKKNFESFIGANDYPIAYLNMPKSACTTIKNILYYLSHKKWHDSPLAIHKNIQTKSVIPKGITLQLNRDEVIAKGDSWLNFTFVRNPGFRAYSAFIEKVWTTGKYSFPGIRSYLIEKGDLPANDLIIPEQILKNELSKSFKNFLKFADKNLKGETPFPSNPHWCVQSKRIQYYKSIQTISFVGKVERFAEDMRYVLSFAGCKHAELADQRFNEGPRPPFRLDEILDHEICDLLFDIYQEDYMTYGYQSPNSRENSSNPIKSNKAKVLYVYRKDRLGMRLVNILQASRFASRAGYRVVATWPSSEWNLEKDDSRKYSQYSLDTFFDVNELNKRFTNENIIFTEELPPSGLLSVKENDLLHGQFPKAFDVSQINELPSKLLVDGFAAGLRFKDETDETVRAGCKKLFDLLPWNKCINNALNYFLKKVNHKPFIAVHIRRGDFKNIIRKSIQNSLTNNESDISPDLARMLRMLKKKTASLATIAKTLESINSPIENILIFSDSPEVANNFASFIENKKSVDVVANWDTEDIDGNQRAAVELLLMSKANYIIGTQSAFTRCAALVGDGKFINAASNASGADEPIAVLNECAGDLLQNDRRLLSACTSFLHTVYSNYPSQSNVRSKNNQRSQCSSDITAFRKTSSSGNNNSFDISLLLSCMHEDLFRGINRRQIADMFLDVAVSGKDSWDIEMNEICDKLGRKTGKILHLIQGLLQKGFTFEALKLAQSYKKSRPYEVAADVCMGFVYEASNQFDDAKMSFKLAMQSAPYLVDPVLALRRLAAKSNNKTEFNYYNNALVTAKSGRKVSKQNLEVFKVYAKQHPVIRLGPNSDGGYVLADLPGSYDLFCSGGISNNCDFENDFCKHFNLSCEAFDPTIKKLPSNAHSRINWHKKAIGYHDNAYCTNLSGILKNYENIFLKLDIESSEYAWLNSISQSEINNIKQLIIEIHNPLHLIKLNLIKKISLTHALIHVHPNNSCPTVSVAGISFPKLLECTYIRKNFMLNNSKLNNSPFPQEHDYRNDMSRDEVCLNDWPFVVS